MFEQAQVDASNSRDMSYRRLDIRASWVTLSCPEIGLHKK